MGSTRTCRDVVNPAREAVFREGRFDMLFHQVADVTPA
jgi:hypothetical protein